MSKIVTISGSSASTSRLELVLKYLGTLLEQADFSVTHISMKDVPSQDFFTRNVNSQVIRNITTRIKHARGVIVGSPVYNDSYSDVLKRLCDILPQDVLKHKPVLPLMTGANPVHKKAFEFALKPDLVTHGAHNLKGVYLLDREINKHSENPIIDEEALKQTKKQLDFFIKLVNNPTLAVSLSY